MVNIYSNILDIIPQYEIENKFSDVLTENDYSYSSSSNIYNGYSYYSEKSYDGNITYWQECCGDRRMLFQVSELGSNFEEFSIYETFIFSHDSIYILFSVSGDERYYIAHIFFTSEGVRRLTISDKIFHKIFVPSSSKEHIYIVGETETGLSIYKINFHSDSNISIQQLPIEVEGKYSQILLGWDFPTSSLKVIVRNSEKNESYLIFDEQGDYNIIFFTAGIYNNYLTIPYGVKTDTGYKILLHVMNFKSNESCIYIYGDGDDTEDCLIYKGCVIDILVVDSIVILIYFKDKSVFLKVFIIKKNLQDYGIIEDNKFLDSNVTSWQIKYEHVNGKYNFIIHSPVKSYSLNFKNRVISLHPIDNNKLNYSKNINKFAEFNQHEVTFAKNGIICKVTIISKYDFKEVEYAHLTGYSFYGMSQTLDNAPRELKSMLNLGKFAYCIVSFEDVDCSESIDMAEGPRRILVKQKLFRRALQEVVSFLRLPYHSISLEGRSAGAILVTPLLKSDPNYIKVALLSKPFLDPYDTFLREQHQGAVSHSYEWGDIHEPEDVKIIQQYSPMHNIPVESNCTILITADPADSRIPFSHILKYANRLGGSGSQVFLAHVGGGHLGTGDTRLRILEFLGEYMWVHRLMSNEN